MRWVSVVLLAGPVVCPADEPPVDFLRDVRPLLADHCFRCHGPDAAAREANLRLDTREGLFGEASDGRVVVPGQHDASVLVARITSDDPDVRMPPPDAKKPLSAEEIAVLKRWVAAGAEWDGHWSFSTPQRPDVPAGDAEHPVDRFLDERLRRERLPANGPASRETLIRRATLALTGLPPTPAEVDAFLADTSPDAYDRLVDRLLASPRYGEHMAVAWLDAARYADTSGYQFDGPRDMWRWRDGLIDALNANQPFDRFTVEQLAGDLLPGATLEQVIASGFNRNHRGNSEGGIVPEEYAVEYVVDRVDTTATVWLGLTLGCARCHDHKYDPLSQREFYRLFDYFNDVPEHGRAIKEGNSPPFVKAPTVEQRRRLASLREREERAHREWSISSRPELAAYQRWRRALDPDGTTDWTITDGLRTRVVCDGERPRNTIGEDRPAAVIESKVAFTESPAGSAVVLDGGFVAMGDVGRFEYREAFSVSAWVNPAAPDGGIVTRMSDDVYSDGWAMHLAEGRVQALFVKRWLDDSLRIETEQTLKPGEWHHVAMTYDGSRTAAGVRVYVNGQPAATRVLLDGLNQSFANDEPLRIGSTGTKRRLRGAVADVRVYDRVLEADEVPVLAAPEPIEVLATGKQGNVPEWRLRAGRAKSWMYFRTGRPGGTLYSTWRDARREREAYEAALPTVMVMQQLDPPRPAFVLKRGEYDKPGDPVEAGVPAVLAASTTRDPGTDRLAFARWLFDPAHPLTARVAVNREWQRFFGRGIVETTEDFGVQGAPPSHPELLDWLATEFVRNGWDVKRLHRLIVTSDAFRRSSRITPRLLEADPANRLLARGPRFRLSAEAVRDQALAASGLLVERIGGPSVKPYQPPGLWADIASAGAYQPGTGDDLHRRSVYSYVKRTVANPTVGVLDATTRESCRVRRTRTNTPLAALALMNDVTFVEAARVLAERSLVHPEGERVAWMFRRALGRVPTAAEARVLTAALQRDLQHYTANPDAARRLLAIGETRPASDIDPPALAAHANVASLLLNLDETVNRP